MELLIIMNDSMACKQQKLINRHQRQRENLENRLLNVNNTVIEAYTRGVDLQGTVDFIRLFTDNTTLTPLRITVYDRNGTMVADNPAATINIYDNNGQPNEALLRLMDEHNDSTVRDITYNQGLNMISAKMSPDGQIYSLAALPYEGEVLAFLSTDPMVWAVVFLLGLLTSFVAYIGVTAICRNVYALRDFAQAIASDRLPDHISSASFSNDELGEVSRNLLTLYRNKIHAEQEKILHERQISSNISHELSTPVGIIKGYIDTIVNDSDMPEETRRKILERIQQNADRLASLVADLNSLMRLDETGHPLQCTPVDLHRLTSRLAQDITQGHIADGMTFRSNIPTGCFVNAHEHLLTNALLNLVSNAARYSGGTEISFNYTGEKDGIKTFIFADNGTGVPEEHLSRIFDLFYRVDFGRTTRSGGRGLGLPLVLRIITSMGGTIHVENAPAGGLRYTITLPVADPS